jgi:hypothetical protein
MFALRPGRAIETLDIGRLDDDPAFSVSIFLA